jgi:hypothetical protein
MRVRISSARAGAVSPRSSPEVSPMSWHRFVTDVLRHDTFRKGFWVETSLASPGTGAAASAQRQRESS